jgi:hypothetical protein
MRMERFTCIDKEKRKGIDIVFFVNKNNQVIHKHVDRIEGSDVEWNNLSRILHQ